MTITSPQRTQNLTRTVMDVCWFTASERYTNSRDPSPRFPTDAIPCREVSRRGGCCSASRFHQLACLFGECSGQRGEEMPEPPLSSSPKSGAAKGTTRSVLAAQDVGSPAPACCVGSVGLLPPLLTTVAQGLGRREQWPGANHGLPSFSEEKRAWKRRYNGSVKGPFPFPLARLEKHA